MDSMDHDIIMRGVLKKKSNRVQHWSERFFILRKPQTQQQISGGVAVLNYYVKETDTEPRGSFALYPNTQLSSITTEMIKKRQYYSFKIIIKFDEEATDEKEDTKDKITLSEVDATKEVKTLGKTKKATTTKDDKNSIITGGKVAALAVGGTVVGALTSGIGLIAGMMVVGMGAAAGGGAVILNHANPGEKERTIVLACDTYDEAYAWVTAIESLIQEQSESFLDLPFSFAGNRHVHHYHQNLPPNHPIQRYRNIRMNPPKEVRLDDVEEWINKSRWKLFSVYEGVRLLSPVNEYCDDETNYFESFFQFNAFTNMQRSQTSTNEKASAPCLRVNISLNGSVSDTFDKIMNFGANGIIKTIRIVEVIDNFTDVIHMKLEPVFIYPSWTAPRDFCLLRYWRDNINDGGGYLICLDSTEHSDCPLTTGFVRAEMHSAYLITPPQNRMYRAQNSSNGPPNKNQYVMDIDDEELMECLLTCISQIDPKGWIWSMYGFQYSFLQEYMLHVLDIRDFLDSERFLQVHFDPMSADTSKMNTTMSGGTIEDVQQGTIFTVPPSILSPTMWAEPDASTFKVRGATYNTDKVKSSSAPSLFKLIAIDMYEVTEATHNIANHPRNRVYQALQRGEDSWVFLVNIMVPGPPFLSFVVYFLGDKNIINSDTPFGRVARPFFFGNDDEFRNNRFKLIPKIVDGNMIIKLAVKDTPTLLGNKLKQYYYKGENYFELDVDVGSSSVARNVVGLAMGYSKAIVVDLGFCLQGNEENELPEVLLGACSAIHVDAGTAKKL